MAERGNGKQLGHTLQQTEEYRLEIGHTCVRTAGTLAGMRRGCRLMLIPLFQLSVPSAERHPVPGDELIVSGSDLPNVQTWAPVWLGATEGSRGPSHHRCPIALMFAGLYFLNGAAFVAVVAWFVAVDIARATGCRGRGGS